MIIEVRKRQFSMLSRVALNSGWTFKQQDWSSDDWLPVANVPSQVHMDLLANKKYKDHNTTPTRKKLN